MLREKTPRPELLLAWLLSSPWWDHSVSVAPFLGTARLERNLTWNKGKEKLAELAKVKERGQVDF